MSEGSTWYASDRPVAADRQGQLSLILQVDQPVFYRDARFCEKKIPVSWYVGHDNTGLSVSYWGSSHTPPTGPQLSSSKHPSSLSHDIMNVIYKYLWKAEI